MRDITDDRNNIAELQRYLREIHHYDRTVPLVNLDGIYGKETADAVSALQESAGLPITGRTDNATWNEIYKAYERALQMRTAPKMISPFPGERGYETEMGERSDAVLAIQLILRALSVLYDDIQGLEADGVYGEATQKDIRIFQQRNRLPITGLVDKPTWNALADAYNSTGRIYN